MPDTPQKRSYDINYVKANQRQYMVKINKKTEPDLYEWMESIGQIQPYIKELIRKDMEAHKAESST